MGQTLKIEYDMEEMFLGIKDAVKKELEEDIFEQIRSEIKAEIKSGILEKIKASIEENTYDSVQNMMKEIYENETVSIGGGWQQEPKVYTLKEYVIKQVKDCITNNKCSGSGYSSESFREWFTNKCVDNEIKTIIEREIKGIRDDVNKNVRDMFDTSTKQMLSETVLNVLMANDTYKKIEKNIGQIASRTDDSDLPCVPTYVNSKRRKS